MSCVVAVTRRLPGVVGLVRSAADATAGISMSTVRASASARMWRTSGQRTAGTGDVSRSYAPRPRRVRCSVSCAEWPICARRTVTSHRSERSGSSSGRSLGWSRRVSRRNRSLSAAPSVLRALRSPASGPLLDRAVAAHARGRGRHRRCLRSLANAPRACVHVGDRRRVRGLRADRLAPAARQPQRAVDGRRRASGCSSRPCSPTFELAGRPGVQRPARRRLGHRDDRAAADLRERRAARAAADRVLVGAMVVQTIAAGRPPALPRARRQLPARPPGRAVAGALDALLGAVAFACLGTAVVIGVRFKRASPPRRRAMLPSVAGISALFLAALAQPSAAPESARLARARRAPARAGRLPREPAALAAGARRPRPRSSASCARCAAPSCRRGSPRPSATRASSSPIARRRVRRRDGAPVRSAGRRPLGRRARRRGARLRRSLDEDPALIEAVASAAAIALEHQRLRTSRRRRSSG